MQSAPWRLDGLAAWLECAALRARLDIARPDAGLHDVELTATALADARLLSVDLPALDRAAPPAGFDAYVRSDDLVATYPQTALRPTRVQVYWRSAPVEGDELAAVDLQVSVQTHLLESVPTLTAASELVADEVLLPPADDPSIFAPVEVLDEPVVLSPARGPSCVVWRLRGKEASYAEMIHPSDLLRDEVVLAPNGAVRLVHRLFAGDLEKGVILRGRIRGVFLPRVGDTELAARQYEAFLAAALPLTA